jgi:hypothetical protein
MGFFMRIEKTFHGIWRNGFIRGSDAASCHGYGIAWGEGLRQEVPGTLFDRQAVH